MKGRFTMAALLGKFVVQLRQDCSETQSNMDGVVDSIAARLAISPKEIKAMLKESVMATLSALLLTVSMNAYAESTSHEALK